AIADALKSNKCAKEIILDDNRIGDQGAQAIAEALKSNRTIVTINLGENNIDDPGAEAIAEMLKANGIFKEEIVLNRNAIGDQGAKAIAKALKSNKTIAKIGLSTISIGDTGREAWRRSGRTRGALVRNNGFVQTYLQFG
ncbi:unnamed protein product, partial [Effrenium voratum]